MTADIPKDFWSSEDQANLQSFLNTRTGGKLIEKLAEAAPTLFSEGDVNKILIRSGELRGYQNALRELLTISVPEPAPEKEATEYPSLLDDSAWPGTEKLDTTT